MNSSSDRRVIELHEKKCHWIMNRSELGKGEFYDSGELLIIAMAAKEWQEACEIMRDDNL